MFSSTYVLVCLCFTFVSKTLAAECTAQQQLLDVNLSGTVDILDKLLEQQIFGELAGSCCFASVSAPCSDRTAYGRYDVNEDGCINQSDLDAIDAVVTMGDLSCTYELPATSSTAATTTTVENPQCSAEERLYDVNLDGIVNILDRLLEAQKVMGWGGSCCFATPSAPCSDMAVNGIFDVNGDGCVNQLDLDAIDSVVKVGDFQCVYELSTTAMIVTNVPTEGSSDTVTDQPTQAPTMSPPSNTAAPTAPPAFPSTKTTQTTQTTAESSTDTVIIVLAAIGVLVLLIILLLLLFCVLRILPSRGRNAHADTALQSYPRSSARTPSSARLSVRSSRRYARTTSHHSGSHGGTRTMRTMSRQATQSKGVVVPQGIPVPPPIYAGVKTNVQYDTFVGRD